jgi:hypothetical protein
MQQIFKWSRNALLAFIPLFFLGIVFGVTFGEGTLLGSFGTALLGAVACTTPFVALTALITGIGMMIEGRTGTSSKRKNDFLAEFDNNPARLQRILRQLSPEDRDYLQQQLAARRLGVSGDGELVTLDDLLAHDDSEDDSEHRSLYTG